jgi:hypothetical protein
VASQQSILVSERVIIVAGSEILLYRRSFVLNATTKTVRQTHYTQAHPAPYPATVSLVGFGGG